MKSKLPKKLTHSKAQKMADDAFSLLVKSRADYKCELHQRIKELGIKDFPVKTCTPQKCCFHIIPKSKGSALRYDPLNAICACVGANFWEKNNRGEWYLWIPRLYPERAEYLLKRRNEIVHTKTGDLVFLAKSFKVKK